jgi:hypothetical protein
MIISKRAVLLLMIPVNQCSSVHMVVFVSVGGYLLERKSIADMYSSMVLLFSFVHSVLL